MKIVSLQENKKIEKRIAITPEITKKYISNGFEVYLGKNYGLHLGFSDDKYKNLGANIVENEKEIVKNADLIVQLGLPSDENLSYLKEDQILIGVLNPYINKKKIDDLVKKKIKNFSLELLPRITRSYRSISS